MRAPRGARTTRPGIPRLPWGRIVTWLAVAVALAWAVGFSAGLLVRFLTPL